MCCIRLKAHPSLIEQTQHAKATANRMPSLIDRGTAACVSPHAQSASVTGNCPAHDFHVRVRVKHVTGKAAPAAFWSESLS